MFTSFPALYSCIWTQYFIKEIQDKLRYGLILFMKMFWGGMNKENNEL